MSYMEYVFEINKNRMLLNVENVLGDSKKISELRKLSKITKHQENSWIPLAQYNSRTNTYVNVAMNIQAITTYTSECTYSYIANQFGSYWIDLMNVGYASNYSQIETCIPQSSITSNIIAYSFTYTKQYLDWQIVDGSYIPDYHIPVHPDNIGIEEPQPMECPIYPIVNKPEQEDNE